MQLSEVDGLLSLPDVRTGDLELVQRHGLWPGDDYMGGRTVTLTLPVYGETPRDFSRVLTAIQAAFAAGEEEKPFRFLFPGLAGDKAAYVKARPRKRSGPLGADFAAGVCTIVVELFATDPHIYGDAGRTVKAVSGIAPGASPVVRLTQEGSVPARPTVKISGAVTPRLENLTTGEFLAVNYTGAFTVDSMREKVIASGGADITGLVDPASAWPEYRHGAHSIRLINGDTSKKATAELSWVDTWI
ncbi:hypothetical protein ACIHFE_18070 [Streptomyces sp. NPDC052396]|uniref:hypothetical protein n=1 Tax=Streptomyces sp. NPDC052396 TaxID=3365689 RepID=UPI0037D7811E